MFIPTWPPFDRREHYDESFLERHFIPTRPPFDWRGFHKILKGTAPEKPRGLPRLGLQRPALWLIRERPPVAKPRTARRGRPIGYMSRQTESVMLMVDFYFEVAVDLPQTERGIRLAIIELASKQELKGSDTLDPDNHTLRAAVRARLAARELAAAARGKAAN